jgi:CRISPR-associated protein Csb2
MLVACALPPAQYESQPLEPKKRGKRASASKLSWLDAIACSTAELLTSRRTEPPAFQHIAYLRPVKCFDPAVESVVKAPRRAVYGVLYALEADVPPPVTATIEVAEQVRRKLMGIHRMLTGNPEAVSEKFTGKDSTGNPLKGHRHCFILPQDRDSDGWLDHLLVISRDQLDSDELRAMYRLESLWQRGGKPDIRCVPVQSGSFTDFTAPASRFISATPFVTLRHYRNGRGEFTDWIVAEVRREAINHGLPPPVRVTPVPNIMVRGRRIFWRDFRRNRREEPVMPGYGFELEFAEPIFHPIALGYACHFGMGQFSPMN